MAAFPTLSRPPIHPLDPDGELEDAILRSPFEAGYEQTRPKYTRARRIFGVRYRIQEADTALLRAFEQVTLVNGADAFDWTHPISAVTYTVRLAAPIKYAKTSVGITDASFTIREV